MTRTLTLNTWPVDEVRWYFATFFDSEHWSGKLASREDVLAQVRSEYANETFDDESGVVCWIASGAARRPTFEPSKEALTVLLEDFIGQNEDCWYEDYPVDPRHPEGDLQDLIAQVLEHHIAPPSQRMIAEFLTMEAVVRREGVLIIDPTIVP